MREIPARLETEEAILGGCLISSEWVDIATERLRSEHFYSPAHGAIFAAIGSLASSGKGVDATAVSDILTKRSEIEMCGGQGKLVSLIAAAQPLPAAIQRCEEVLDMARMRALIDAGDRIGQVGYSGAENTSQAHQQAEKLLSAALSVGTDDDLLLSFEGLCDEVLEELLESAEGRRKSLGVPSGLVNLDALIHGLKPGALVIVGGRPGMGKTVLACTLARSVAIDAGMPVLFVSLEMPGSDLARRMICGEARIDHGRLTRQDMTQAEWTRFHHHFDILRAAPITVVDTQETTASIRARARRIRREQGALGLIIVDYVQLMVGRSGAENRQTEVAEISRSLKILAREMDCPVVALAALNRSLESRADKRPMLSDLREFGALESDADIVIFTYRDEVYEKNTEDKDVIELIVGKHRAGPTGTARAVWMGHFQTVANFG